VPPDVAVAGGDSSQLVVAGGVQTAELFLPLLTVRRNWATSWSSPQLLVTLALGHAEQGAFLGFAFGQAWRKVAATLDAGDDLAALALEAGGELGLQGTEALVGAALDGQQQGVSGLRPLGDQPVLDHGRRGRALLSARSRMRASSPRPSTRRNVPSSRSQPPARTPSCRRRRTASDCTNCVRAGGWLRDDGTFRRVEGLGELARILDRALSQGTPRRRDPGPAGRPVAEGRDALLLAIERRTDERFRSLQAKLATRLQGERRQIVTSVERFAATLRQALAEGEAEEGALFSVAEGSVTRSWGDDQEVAQFRRDREKWQEKLRGLDAARDYELRRVSARYRDIRRHSFPVAVIFVVPRREAVR